MWAGHGWSPVTGVEEKDTGGSQGAYPVSSVKSLLLLSSPFHEDEGSELTPL